MTTKIISLDYLTKRSEELRAAGKKIVVTNGCFDLLHVGHVRYLQAARALGDVLIVGINGDQSVRSLKGGDRPINNENDRSEIVAALECVDLVAIFPEARATRLLERARPAIYAKGGDYSVATLNSEERAVLEKNGVQIQIIPLAEGYSTTALVRKLGRSPE